MCVSSKENGSAGNGKKISNDLEKSHLFNDREPAQKWYGNLLKRHPEISIWEAESINKARAIITEDNSINFSTATNVDFPYA